jgi:hypothetical protein
MALNAGPWDAYYESHCDLSDVEGTPGVAPEGVATLLADQFGGEAADVAPPENGLFVVGRAPAPLESLPEALAAGVVIPGVQEEPGLTESAPLVSLTSATGTHVVFQQRLRGVEVIGARYSLHYRPGDTAYALTGRPVGDLPERDPGEAPTANGPADAAAAARARFALAADHPVDVEQVLFPTAGTTVWAWQARISVDDPPADLRAFFDADLQLLLVYNIASASLWGEGQVYPVNPSRTPSLRRAALQGIGPDPSDHLKGPEVVVVPRSGAGVANSLRNFTVDPTDKAFDEATTWYHLGWALEWFRHRLGPEIFTRPPFTPLYAVVRDTTAPDNSYFLPDRSAIHLGDFGDRPGARSADIIIHELGHAISDAICRLGRSMTRNTPARGMSEGYSDYFAAAALGDPRIGDYVGDVEAGARNLARAGLRFSAVQPPEEHGTGEVWGGVLWALRDAIGAELTDVLVLESLQYLGPNSTLEGGAQALVEADRVLFPADESTGRHRDAIATAFASRQ